MKATTFVITTLTALLLATAGDARPPKSPSHWLPPRHVGPPLPRARGHQPRLPGHPQPGRLARRTAVGHLVRGRDAGRGPEQLRGAQHQRRRRRDLEGGADRRPRRRRPGAQLSIPNCGCRRTAGCSSFWAQMDKAGATASSACGASRPPSRIPSSRRGAKPRRIGDGVMMCKPLVAFHAANGCCPSPPGASTTTARRWSSPPTTGKTWTIRGGCNVPVEARAVRRAHVRRAQGRLALAAGPHEVRHRRKRLHGSRQDVARAETVGDPAHAVAVLHHAAGLRQPAAGQARPDRQADRPLASDGLRLHRRRQAPGAAACCSTNATASPIPTASRRPTA